MILPEPIWAIDIQNLIGIIIVILFIVIPAIGQLLARMNKADGPPAGRPRPGGGPRAGAGPARKGIEDQIGDFLRRVAQGQGGQAPRAQVRQPPRPQPRPPQPVGRPVVAEVVGGRPIAAEVVDRAHREDVDPAINTRDIARHASKLGGEVARTERLVDKHLHDVFNHEVSELAKEPGRLTKRRRASKPKRAQPQPAPLPATSAAGFAALLSNAQSIRQAIVINEILTRPLERWE